MAESNEGAGTSNPGPLSSEGTTTDRDVGSIEMTSAEPDPATAGADQAAFQDEHRRTVCGSPGETYCIPVGSRLPGDEKPERRHTLAVPASDVRAGTAVYGTQTMPKREWYTPHAGVMGTGRTGNGLPAQTTYFIGSALIAVFPRALRDRRGVLQPADWDRLRRQLKNALGIGSGTHATPGVPTSSWRGRVIQVPRDFGLLYNFAYAAVLTEHAHSAALRHQILLPIYVSDPELDDPTQDVVVSDGAIADLLRADRVVWSVPAITSIFVGEPPRRSAGNRDARSVLKQVGLTIPDADLTAVETILTDRFALRDVR